MEDNSSQRSILRQMGLFKLIGELFALKRQNRQMLALEMAFENILACLKEETNLALALGHLDAAERIAHRIKVFLTQTKEKNRRVFKGISPQTQKAEIIAVSGTEDVLEYISGLKVLIKILLETNKSGEGLLEQMGDLLSWLGFDTPRITVYSKEEMIDYKKWKEIIIKSAECRTFDDMPANIRRRHRGLKEIFEGAGGRFYYDVDPSWGTTIRLSLPCSKKGAQ